MAGEWIRVVLADVIELVSGGTPKTNIPEYWNGNIPWLSVADFNAGFRWVSSAEKHITERGLYESAAKLLNERDIIISARGTVGALAQLAKPMAFNQSCYGVRGRRGIADTDFIYYFLRQAVAEMKQVAHGGVFDTITRDTFKLIRLSLPPLPEQRAIAHILGTLDDKIELNRKQNETLEAMARALFKAWFVDFEPVRAKMEGRWQRGQSLPGLPAHLYDLFPDRLVESELGETNSPRANLDDGIGGPQGGGRESRRIPEGWEWAPASRLIEFNPREALRKGTVAPYLEMSALPTSGSWPEPPVLRPFGSGMRFRNGDTLLARITPCLENGKTAFVQCLPDNAVGWGSTEFIVMRPRHPVPKEFGYLLARDDAFRAHAIRSMTGTSGRQRVQADSVANFPVAMPSNEVCGWSSRVLSLLRSRASRPTQKRLKPSPKLRDTLLPKLISGELRVKNVERFLEAAT
jgi:Restriction endonuclease S subunits